jgi:murein L,D-transpeptidase YafK
MNRVIALFSLLFLFLVNTSFFSYNSKGSYYIVVDKSDYEMHVYDAEGWLITYPVVFGNKDMGDKLYQGDRKTPEGTFSIILKKYHQKWDRYLALNYPTAADVEKFNQRKAQGMIPKSARIGGDIGIHGTWPREDYAIDQFQNWTLGCISLKNEHVEQLYSMISVGTKITIQR